MKQNRLELRVGAEPQNLLAIADFISRSVKLVGMEESILEIQTAVDEACTNVIKHAYSDKGGIISITCELQDNDFVITIGDNGRPFDPNSILPPDLESDLDRRKIGGLGIYLMKKLMDDVSYSFDAKDGNKVVMKKRLTAKM